MVRELAGLPFGFKSCPREGASQEAVVMEAARQFQVMPP